MPLDSRAAAVGQRGRCCCSASASRCRRCSSACRAIDWLRIWIADHTDKTNLDLLQYVHFLAEAYVAVVLLKGREQVLLQPPWGAFVKCGQQALSIYVTCEILAHLGGMAFDHCGNGCGDADRGQRRVPSRALFAVAYVAAWAKRAPWKRAAGAPAPLPASVTAVAAAPRSGARSLALGGD